MSQKQNNPRGIGFTGMGCSGKSSLGKAVADLLGWRFIEYDNFKRDKGSVLKLPVEEIIKRIEQEIMSSDDNFIYDGFVSMTINDQIMNQIDAAIKVDTPLEVRIARAKARFQTNENRADQFANLDSYLEQQIAYENNTSTKFTKKEHDTWFAKLNILKATVDGTMPINECANGIARNAHMVGLTRKRRLPLEDLEDLKDEDPTRL